MTRITSHVLDTSRGKPAEGISVALFQQNGDEWKQLWTDVTNPDGRIAAFASPDISLPAGTYKLRFDTGRYFEQNSIVSLYPFIEIAFSVDRDEHYHVPLLLSPFGYSTYRGS